MARTTDPIQHEKRRAHIKGVASFLISSQGYDNTSTAQIAKAAKISSGSFFHYFHTKRDLFIAILTDDTAKDTEDELASALADPDPWQGLVGYVTRRLAGASTIPFVPGLVIEALLQAKRDPELAELLDKDARNEATGLRQLLERARAAGVIDSGLELARAERWLVALSNVMYLEGALNDEFDPAQEMETLKLLLGRFLRSPRTSDEQRPLA
ncbi:TetR/AcrR family transcriptional regulator [Saxibacter everestensis]|uniref:TetR/AcrR family transcriptional regulator n=1 Tax=Saxibacter everestensis TaxID=2909229 RepID=A0ABY8QWE2_9MICO|nr:TetR/AcrR family transcriptional regulator [Brevibacteriaceae bacterium ZFBP1038]